MFNGSRNVEIEHVKGKKDFSPKFLSFVFFGYERVNSTIILKRMLTKEVLIM
jgi:hypothetical protein